MGIEMPAEVKWLIPIVVGDSWPEGDETALQRLGEVWKQAAGDVDEAMRQAEDAVKQATSHMDGEAAEAFKNYWEKFVKGEEATLPKMKDVSEKLATACRNCAMQIEYAKLSIIIALVILAIQIAVMLASAVVSFGASTAGIVPAQLATRAGVQIVFRQLVQRLMQQVGRNLIGKLALQVGIEVATSVATDLAVQGIQLAKGTRDSLDTSLTLDAAKSGLISGVVGAGVGAGMGKAFGDGLGDSLGRSIGRNAAEEAVIGAGSALVEGALSEEGIKGSDVLFGATSGAISGSVSGAKSGIEGLNADIDVPTAGDMPRPSGGDMPRPDGPSLAPTPSATAPSSSAPSTPDTDTPPRRSSDATNMSYAAPPAEQPQHRAAPDTTPAAATPSPQPQGFQQGPAAPQPAPPAPGSGGSSPAAPRAAAPVGGFAPTGSPSSAGSGPTPGHAPTGGHTSGGPSATSTSHSAPSSPGNSGSPAPAASAPSHNGPPAGSPAHSGGPQPGTAHAGQTSGPQPGPGSPAAGGPHANPTHAGPSSGSPIAGGPPHNTTASGPAHPGLAPGGQLHSGPAQAGPVPGNHPGQTPPAGLGGGPSPAHSPSPQRTPAADAIHQAATAMPFAPGRAHPETAAPQSPAPVQQAPAQQHSAPQHQAPPQPRPPAPHPSDRPAPQRPHQAPPQHQPGRHQQVQRPASHQPGQPTGPRPAPTPHQAAPHQTAPHQRTATHHAAPHRPAAAQTPHPQPTPHSRSADAATPHERPPRSPWEERKRLNTPVALPDNLKHLQPDVKHTRAGLSLHDNNFKAYSHSAAMVAPDPHRYTVDLHGSADDVRVGDTKLSPKDLADIIRSSGDWDGKQPVRLISCQTGTKADGFAAQLSKELGVDVVSPTKDAWVDDMGNVFASSTHFDPKRGDFSPGWPPNGDWVTFRPDGTSTKHDRPTPPGSSPTWGDVMPQDRPRAWRRGEDGTWVTDANDNWHFVPARNAPPPHPVRGGEQPQWTPNQAPPNHNQPNRQGPPPGFPPPGRAPQRPVQGPPPGRFPQGGQQNPMRHDPRQQQQRTPQPEPRRFQQQQQQPGGFGPRGFDPDQQHRQGPPPNQNLNPRQTQGFVPNQDPRRPVPPPGADGRPLPPRPMQPPPQSFGPDPRHAAPEHRPPQQPDHVDAPPRQHQPPVAEQPKEVQRTPDGVEWVPLEEQLTATRDHPITATELALRERALELYAKDKGLFYGYDRMSLKAEVSKFKVGLDGKFVEVPYEPPAPPPRPDRLTPEYLKDLAEHVATHGQPATPAHTFTPKSDDLPPGRTAQIPPGAYANTVVPVHPAHLHFNTSGNGDRLIHRNEPDFLNKKNALFRRMSYNIAGVENGAGIPPKGTSGNAESHIGGDTNSIYVSFTDSLEHVMGRPPSALPPKGHRDGHVMVDYIVEAYHPNGIDSDASFHDAGVASPHRENEYIFAGGMPDENVFRIWKLEVTLDASGNPKETRVVGSRVNHRFKYLSQMGVR